MVYLLQEMLSCVSAEGHNLRATVEYAKEILGCTAVKVESADTKVDYTEETW
ncbi:MULTISPECIES: hypothetical protein [Sphingobacterium]|uniref:hypothetical protein n=1 Tax=Sphingobacterium TaxID=28453 RepID=UPI00224303DD|nr:MULTISPECIES: hypothetical protein [Sphingobacterium]